LLREEAKGSFPFPRGQRGKEPSVGRSSATYFCYLLLRTPLPRGFLLSPYGGQGKGREGKGKEPFKTPLIN